VIKVSLLIVAVLTVIFAMLLRWREERLDRVAAAGGARPRGWMALGKRKVNRWITAAALAALATMLALGGVQWVRVWVAG
jgi:hypothetical protein